MAAGVDSADAGAEVEVETSSAAGLEVATGVSDEDDEDATMTAAAVEDDTTEEALPVPEGAAGAELSSARVQPEFLVMVAVWYISIVPSKKCM